MNFQHNFTVAAPTDAVWAGLMDIERSAACVPGAEVLERNGADAYRVRVKVKLGPISLRPDALVRIAERDDNARRATLTAVASRTGGGKGEARAQLSVTSTPPGSRVTLNTELALDGTAAVLGQRLIAELAAVLVEAFATNFERMLAQPSGRTETAPLGVSKVAVTVVGSRLRDPRTLVAAALLCAVVGYALGRRRP